MLVVRGVHGASPICWLSTLLCGVNGLIQSEIPTSVTLNPPTAKTGHLFHLFHRRYAKKHGFPVLNNVVLPRVGALGTLLNTLPTEASHQNGSNGVANDHHKSQCAFCSLNLVARVNLRVGTQQLGIRLWVCRKSGGNLTGEVKDGTIKRLCHTVCCSYSNLLLQVPIRRCGP